MKGNRPGAVALAYDGVAAPRVIARAEDGLQREMLELAQRHGVPIHRDAKLAGLLAQVRLDDEIPLQLFVAVAEVLAFAYRLRGDAPPGWTAAPGDAGATPPSTDIG
ncbi:MAG: EscU/YscU/HrcU family type III secretion system export apparatus switch protein [Perlucidibaca sp.]